MIKSRKRVSRKFNPVSIWNINKPLNLKASNKIKHPFQPRPFMAQKMRIKFGDGKLDTPPEMMNAITSGAAVNPMKSTTPVIRKDPRGRPVFRQTAIRGGVIGYKKVRQGYIDRVVPVVVPTATLTFRKEKGVVTEEFVSPYLGKSYQKKYTPLPVQKRFEPTPEDRSNVQKLMRKLVRKGEGSYVKKVRGTKASGKGEQALPFIARRKFREVMAPEGLVESSWKQEERKKKEREHDVDVMSSAIDIDIENIKKEHQERKSKKEPVEREPTAQELLEEANKE